MTTAPSSSDKPRILDGKRTAIALVDEVRETVEREGLTPGLAVVLVGDDPASAVYVRNKGRRAEACGFLSRQYDLPATTTQAELLELIESLNADADIHGILVQLPLPAQIDADRVIQAIAPNKDVDGFHYINVGRLATGAIDAALLPCTPKGAMHLIEQVLGPDLSGQRAVVIGRSNIVGKPMASLLLARNATVTVIHSRTPSPAEICRQADIVVAAVGVPGLVTAEWVKPGAVVIDVGINRVEGEDGKARLVGDVDFEAVAPLASAITPVPGGVGPMTIAMLMHNTLQAARRQSASSS
ncbi:bifunctional protein FolD [Litchfieldella qijiaojingensis]|uniref:Bifunctional protein FolD n=1 Tax=Litchfieldella qijiaojingensis TaxID=980347 RepID=A0ABQ2YH04_9GAMM|nr:bifunctional methylenetetrahydrofolate dehydrogenase/methenyltetrahydrofolate cyclohydrolase FolD [Halomonas qijiaojingensis]GGX84053.1 bifunctional protein FolD [Halomonas qijiaojingensis]